MSFLCRSGVEKKAVPTSTLGDRISEDASTIEDPNFDVCIIGSGYGGSIAASRLSRAGKRVCLLEKGKEFRPGQFPENFWQSSEEMQIHKDGKLVAGRSNGLYEFRIHKDVNVVKGCGLGGTSLINANVALRADPRIFTSESWPEAILDEMGVTSNPDEAAANNNSSSPAPEKKDKGKEQAKENTSPAPVHKPKHSEFDKWYNFAQEMLNPTPYPGDVPKMKAMKAAAAYDGSDFYLPPITVNFEGNNYVNKAGVPQPACNDCGDCCSGCNTGAKNTLLMNYLPDARNHGCQIYTQADVRHISKSGDKWNVWYRPLNTGREAFPDAPDLFISASVVIVSGGSLGSTEILARSKREGLNMSDAIGTRFTGNGDLLGFAFNTKYEIENIKDGVRKVGPCITSIIDKRKAEDMKLGFVVEDGTHPRAIAKLYADILCNARNFSEDQGFKKWVKDTVDIVTQGNKPFNHSLSYLIMAQDSAQGKLELHDDALTVNWPKAGQEPFVDNAFSWLDKSTKEALDGVFIADPITENPLTPKELITVHPLGGCVMGDDAKNSVVNHKGQVWDGQGGVHKGLYVMDGSIIPSCVGVNPFFTISAVCERAVHLLAKDYNWEIQKGDVAIVNKKKSKAPVGVQFTERMTGWWSDKEQNSFEEGVKQGKEEGCELAFTVLVDVDNIDKMMATPAHRGKITGTLHCPKLSDRDLTVADGVFNLFENDPNVPAQKLMKYTLKVQDHQGGKYLMYGFKVVKDNLCGLNAWEQTTTLFCTMYSGWEISAKNQLGKGMIYIQVLNFARQLTTLKITNAQDRTQRLQYLAKFGRFFAGSLWDIYGPVGSTIGTVEVPRQKRPLRLPVPEIHNFVTSDGLTLRLTRYCHTEGADKGGKGPLLMIPGMGVSPRIFTLDTVQTSFGEYLYEQGFDIFLMDMRLSSDLGYAAKVKNLDEVKLDFLPAVNKVLEVTGANDLQVLCHCVGALGFFMSVCTGELAGKVRSIASSTTGIYTIPGPMKKAQADLHFPQLVKLFKSAIDPCVENDKFNKLLGTKLSALGIPKEEVCNSPICHRVTFMYGLIWQHHNMNSATHDSIAEYFGTGSLDIFNHVAACVRKGHIVDNKEEDVYLTPENAKHLRMPIFFVSGEKNVVWEPKSTEEARDWLIQHNPDLGADNYTRYVVPDYGHSDCIYGKNAARDVYPHFADFFNKHL